MTTAFRFILFVLLARGLASPAAELLPPGHRPVPPGAHALVGGRIVTKPGQVFDSATLIIRDGLIEAVGPDLALPADARVWNMKGMTIYAGFIDPYLTSGASNAPVATDRVEPIAPFTDTLTAGGIKFFGVPGQEADPGHPGPGHELSPLTPERRVAQSYAPDGRKLEAMRELGFTAANVVPDRGVMRGTSAFVALSDLNPHDAILKTDTFQHVAFDTGGARESSYPRSLMGVIASVRQTFFDARHDALDQAAYRSQLHARKRPGFNPALQALVPAVEGRMPVVIEPGSALMVDRAARIARELELSFYLVSCGQEWRRPDLAKAAATAFIVPVNYPALPKLPEDDDWHQVTLDQLRAWDWSVENPALLRRLGLEIGLTTHGLGDKKHFRKNLQLAIDRGLSEDDAIAGLTTIPAKLCGLSDRLGTIEPGKIANLTVVQGNSYFQPDAKVGEVWIDGRICRVAFDAPKAPRSRDESGQKPAESKRKTELRELQKQRVARSPQGSRGPLAEPAAVFVKGATIWTCGPEGRLENAHLLVVDGKIRAVGQTVTAPADLAGNVVEIDGRGLQVTPGLIDAHNHSFVLGGINEGTIPSSAMVRIGDVLNSETDNFHRQLAGGLTAANVLHGSANPIGGQNAVIKLKEGAAPEELKIDDAPSGIKFALGENVKQANWGDRNVTRFPQTRMGVRTFMANRFIAARAYLKSWQEFRAKGGVPPRRDLELETLGEILEGKRWIHCHSYRQDEIVAFLRVMEEFGVKVATLQHVLEGYKVADEIAQHGAGASCFSDWWAYKFEVFDAIPYAGSLMRARGVLVSFNSDSSDLARRLYIEAAKAVKYGGTAEEEALKFVTLNPAKQLRIDHRIGSLSPGKDGDFVVWSGSPLDTSAVCLQTWIEGRKYFDRDQARERAAALANERAELVQKAKRASRLSSGATGEQDAAAQTAFWKTALEHEHEHDDRHCEDE
jgi:imidazolonepropionase-like amidohydrolase